MTTLQNNFMKEEFDDMDTQEEFIENSNEFNFSPENSEKPFIGTVIKPIWDSNAKGENERASLEDMLLIDLNLKEGCEELNIKQEVFEDATIILNERSKDEENYHTFTAEMINSPAHDKEGQLFASPLPKIDKEECLKLIHLYGNYKRLWDSQSPQYTNRKLREDAWRNISWEMGRPIPDLKRKMESIMGSYRKEKSREKKSHISGSGRDDVYRSSWYAYEAFSFLSDRNDPGNTQHSIHSPNQSTGCENNLSQLKGADIKEESEITKITHEVTQTSNSNGKKKSTRAKKVSKPSVVLTTILKLVRLILKKVQEQNRRQRNQELQLRKMNEGVKTMSNLINEKIENVLNSATETSTAHSRDRCNGQSVVTDRKKPVSCSMMGPSVREEGHKLSPPPQQNDDEVQLKRWFHSSLPWLTPSRIRDKNLLRPDETGYDPGTIFIPDNFLDTQTEEMKRWWRFKADHYKEVVFIYKENCVELHHMDAVVAIKTFHLPLDDLNVAYTVFRLDEANSYADGLRERGYKVVHYLHPHRRATSSDSVAPSQNLASGESEMTDVDAVQATNDVEVQAADVDAVQATDVEVQASDDEVQATDVDGMQTTDVEVEATDVNEVQAADVDKVQATDDVEVEATDVNEGQANDVEVEAADVDKVQATDDVEVQAIEESSSAKKVVTAEEVNCSRRNENPPSMTEWKRLTGKTVSKYLRVTLDKSSIICDRVESASSMTGGLRRSEEKGKRINFEVRSEENGKRINFEVRSDEENRRKRKCSQIDHHKPSTSSPLNNLRVSKSLRTSRSSSLSSTPSNIEQPTTEDNNNIRGKRACPFCKDLITMLSHHLKLKHKHEKEVKEILSLPKEEQEKCFSRLQKRGIESESMKPLKESSRNQMNVSLRAERGSRSKLSMCPNCKKSYAFTYYLSHIKLCEENWNVENTINRAPIKISSPSAHLYAVDKFEDIEFHKGFHKEFLGSFCYDDLGIECKRNETIKYIGFCLYLNKCGYYEHEVPLERKEVGKNLVMRKMRMIARLYLEFQKEVKGVPFIEMFNKTYLAVFKKAVEKTVSHMFTTTYILSTLINKVIDLLISRLCSIYREHEEIGLLQFQKCFNSVQYKML